MKRLESGYIGYYPPFTKSGSVGVFNMEQQTSRRSRDIWRTKGIDPSDLSPDVWFDFNDVSSITVTASNAITQINDKSANARHATQSTDSKRPVLEASSLNGKYAGNWDTAANSKSLRNSTGSFTPAEIYIVAQYNSVPSYSYFVGNLGLFNGNSANINFWATTDNGVPSFGDANIKVYVNSNNNVDRRSNVFPEVSSTCLLRFVIPSNYTATGLTIGSFFSDNTGWKGRIGEIVAFASPLSTSNRSGLEDYFFSKWLL
jgi:hypothetical protein